MTKFHLKTYFYAKFEIPYLLLQIYECGPYVDNIIICECKYTHQGGEREEMLFDKYVAHRIPENMRGKITYIPFGDRDHIPCETLDERIIHGKYEPYMRSHFLQYVDKDDIVLSVDCDEVIYGHKLPELYQLALERPRLLRLYQMFYKPNYYWEDCEFIAPTIGRVGDVKDPNWRYVGEKLPGYWGVHFSWCMTPEEMIYKLKSYSHPQYRNCARLDILTDAIENRKYPFDPKRKFNLIVLDKEQMGYMLPGTFRFS